MPTRAPTVATVSNAYAPETGNRGADGQFRHEVVVVGVQPHAADPANSSGATCSGGCLCPAAGGHGNGRVRSTPSWAVAAVVSRGRCLVVTAQTTPHPSDYGRARRDVNLKAHSGNTPRCFRPLLHRLLWLWSITCSGSRGSCGQVGIRGCRASSGHNAGSRVALPVES